MCIRRKRFLWLKVKLVVISLIWLLCLFSAPAMADILIICNKTVSATGLSRNHIQDIFLGKRVLWENNHAIHVFVLKEEDIHKAFLEEYVHKSESQWKAYWKRMVFTGRGLPPKSINTEAELIDLVAKTNGAIGYVSTEGLPEDTEANSVKILKSRGDH